VTSLSIGVRVNQSNRRGFKNDRLLTVVASHSSLFRRIDIADTFLTNNRMTAILILLSYANISDCIPRFRGVSLDIDKQK
jgi:hypothetical protein